MSRPEDILVQMRRQSTIYRRHERRLAINQAKRSRKFDPLQNLSSVETESIQGNEEGMNMIPDDATTISLGNSSPPLKDNRDDKNMWWIVAAGAGALGLKFQQNVSKSSNLSHNNILLFPSNGYSVASPFERAASPNFRYMKRFPRSALAWPATAVFTIALFGKQAASKQWRNLH